ncbi:hypothetical protein [Jiangella rhizosphaerae]|uniref:Uncharacterized protein n=1 Tax=Jiangella rhizosphaerae TaxID=2293569 RepID=A0A418KZ23_9ACTN|nr:hypothetical protein [Jiangella rhizosphaerae]RIQ37791.1 hypothetical protein DY240_00160 [Jiangella rhizosphaerae]
MKTMTRLAVTAAVTLGALAAPMTTAASAGPAATAVASAHALDRDATITPKGQTCWSTPGGIWRVTCIKGPHRYKTQCNMMRTQMINAGYETLACRWMTWGSWGTGWYFYYG